MGEKRHISGKELCDGLRELAIQAFGPMSLYVLNEWGFHSCEDFGKIVFDMVERGMMGKQPGDTYEDFKDGFDFNKAFRDPFLPPSKLTP